MFYLNAFLFYLWMIAIPSAHGNLPHMNFLHRVVLDQLRNYVLLWTPETDRVTFEVQVRTQGYVGLGFSTSGGMKGSDIVIGWIDESGKTVFHDRHATGNKTPVIDKSQDYELLGATKNATHTVFRFRRPWITCDDKDDIKLTEETVRVIWAYDARLPNPLRPEILNMHDHRGTKSLYLKEEVPFKVPSSSEAKEWDLMSPEVRVPEGLDTLYWCKLFKAPQLSRKTHIIGYVPLINEISLPHAHHILFYECSLSDSEYHFEKWVSEKGAQCYSHNMPLVWSACGTPIVAWAIGSQGEVFPEHVGFPLGEKHGGSTYFLMETHFDIPTPQKDLVLQSGLRLFITEKLRKYDAGMLTLGHKVEPTMIIPPGQIWDNVGHCTSECTRKTIPPDGIRVISGTMHAHNIAHKIRVQLIRNDREQESFIEDQNYDFNYQQNRLFKKEKLIKPGDHLITTCTYNSMRRSQPTFGGFRSDDEMCLVFLMYYPRIELSQCYSRPDIANLLYTLGIKNLYDNSLIMRLFSEDSFSKEMVDKERERKNFLIMKNLETPGDNNPKLIKLVNFFKLVEISAPRELDGKTLYDVVMDPLIWRNMSIVRRLEQAITHLQYEPTCLYSGRKALPNMAKKAKFPRYIPHKPEPVACVKGNNTIEPQFQDVSVDIDASKGGVADDFEPLPSNELSQQHRRKQERSSASTLHVSLFLYIFMSILVT